MSLESILGVLISAIVSGIATYLVTINKNKAEAEKFKAEAEKSKAEAEKARAETEKIRLGMLPAPAQAEAHTAPPAAEISLLTAERSQLSSYYIEQVNATASLEIITLTLRSALENFGEVKFIQWLQAGKKIRILILAPDSMAAKLRSRQESPDEHFLSAKIVESLVALKNLYARAEKQLKGQDYTGSLEVRLFDDLPYFSYFHTDKALVMGLYYGHLRGLQSDALLVDEKSAIHTKMREHFNDLWNKSSKRGAQNMTLLTLIKGRARFNEALLASFQHPAP